MATQTYATHRHNPKLTGVGFLLLIVAAVAFALRWFEHRRTADVRRRAGGADGVESGRCS